MGNLLIMMGMLKMVIFHSFLYVYQAGYDLGSPEAWQFWLHPAAPAPLRCPTPAGLRPAATKRRPYPTAMENAGGMELWMMFSTFMGHVCII